MEMNKQIIVVSGPFGSGLNSFKLIAEELGYFICENIPYECFFELIDKLKEKGTDKCCLILNLELAKKFNLEMSKQACYCKYGYTFILLSTNKNELLKRYALTRNIHPLTSKINVSLETAIDLDLKMKDEVKSFADLYIDTSYLSLSNLRKSIYFFLNKDKKSITKFKFTSFGLKHSIPCDLDMFFDVRNIPNPYWQEDLRDKDGLEKEVISYIDKFEVSQDLINNIISYLDFWFDVVNKKGRPSYNVGIACSGGKHRSVYVCEKLFNHFLNKYDVCVIHRDKDKE